MKTIPCPRCKKPTVYDEKNKFRPFCSQRCRMIDLGNWADESYSIPDKLEDQSESLEASESEADNEDEA